MRFNALGEELESARSALERSEQAVLVMGVLTVIGLITAALALPLLPRILQVEDTLQKADFILPLARLVW